MFLILPLLLCLQLMSVALLAVLGAFYGVGLILLAHVLRNVRQETSRSSLREFLNYVAIDQLLAAGSTCGCIVLLLVTGGQGWLTSALGNSESDVVGLCAIMAFFVVTDLFVGGLLLMMNADFKSHVPTFQQLRWVPWSRVLVVVGILFNLPTAGAVLIIASPLLWHLNKMDRIGRQSSLIWTLAIATRQGLPLGQEVAVLAEGLWGGHRMRLQLLSENLDAGLSLAAALERQPGLVPLSALMLIRMGEETHCLVPALENCATGFSRKHERHIELISAEQTLTLLMVPLVLMPQIVGFLCYYIMPKFKKIFLDFGVELPLATQYFVHTTDQLARWSPLLLGVGPIGAITIVILLAVRDWERDWPLLDLLAPRVNGPPVLRGLALLIREQRPLLDGVQAMSWSHPRASVRRRLAAIHRDLHEGKDLADSLADKRLIRRGDVMLLRTAEQVRNLPWVLDQLADLMEHKFWYRIRLCMEVGYPIGIILVALLVLAVALAFFMPLVQLIETIA